jgi:hypothetical protein
LLICEECGCFSKTGRGWVAGVVEALEDEDADPQVVTYCPPCAEREFEVTAHMVMPYT